MEFCRDMDKILDAIGEEKKPYFIQDRVRSMKGYELSVCSS